VTGRELRAAREALGLSRAAFCASLERDTGIGVHPHTLYYWETERRRPAGAGGMPSGVVDWVRAELAKK
jgi:DNA-binding transcriptional regulator YiaG